MPIPDIAALPSSAFITTKQLANLTGFAPLTVKGWRRYGRGPKVSTVNGKPRFRVADVRDWLNTGIGGAA
jgi:hypothetical protein